MKRTLSNYLVMVVCVWYLRRKTVRCQAVGNGAGSYDYDLVIIGCGVGGHGAAMHAVEQVQH